MHVRRADGLLLEPDLKRVDLALQLELMDMECVDVVPEAERVLAELSAAGTETVNVCSKRCQDICALDLSLFFNCQ